MKLDRAAAIRILDAMRLAPGGASIDTSKVNPDLLIEELSEAFQWQQYAADLPKLRETSRRRLTEIQRAARSLARLLREEEADVGRLRDYPLVDPNPRRVALKVALAARASRTVPREPMWATDAADALMHNLTARSHFECLVGELISPVFDRHISDNLPQYTTNPIEDTTDSPKLRFIEAALLEFDFDNDGKPTQESRSRGHSPARRLAEVDGSATCRRQVSHLA